MWYLVLTECFYFFFEDARKLIKYLDLWTSTSISWGLGIGKVVLFGFSTGTKGEFRKFEE
jgi:hypothetical protein